MMTATDKQTISLLIGLQPGYGPGILEGVAARATETGRWLLRDDMINWIVGQGLDCDRNKPDGVICGTLHPDAYHQIARLNVPTVAVCSTEPATGIPYVGHDHQQAAVEACQHLLRHGYQRLAYFGSADPVIRRFCDLQIDGIASATGKQADEIPAFFHGPRSARKWTLPNQLCDLVDWLTHVGPPLGLITWDDEHGHRASLAVRQAGLRCPEDVAIVSACSNGAHCLISDPPLTTVVVNERSLGYQAAVMLEDVMAGESPASIRVPPLAVVPRQSSLHFAVEDELVADALWLIWRNLEHGVNVEWLARRLSCSRRTLTRRFKSALGRNPSEEVSYARVEMTKRMLIQSDLPLAEIAVRCGFEYISHLSRAVKRATGLPPSIYRRTYRPGG